MYNTIRVIEDKNNSYAPSVFHLQKHILISFTLF